MVNRLDQLPNLSVRDSVHGFIAFNDWERTIIDHPAFQRLRRIRQLALSEFVYPGSNHTRFAHALGTMDVATRMFDSIVSKQWDYLRNIRKYDEAGIRRDRQIVRLAALLHDVGHSPFSHSGEALFPLNPATGRKHHHEEYSSKIIETAFCEAIEQHPGNENYGIKASDVANIVSGVTNPSSPGSARRLMWRPIVTSQLDADRCDYLLRDSLHAGVSYGRYDLDRILDTINLGLDESDDTVIAIEEGGWHAAEGLIIARYSMFAQVYFQRTRQALDHHVEMALSKLLGNEYGTPEFPPPEQSELEKYLAWDDWMAMGKISSGEAESDGAAILERNPFRLVHQTSETPTARELEIFDRIFDELGDLVGFVRDAEKTWYSLGEQDLQIVRDGQNEPRRGRPLSTLSSIVRNMNPVSQKRIYVSPSNREEAMMKVHEFEQREGIDGD